MPDEDGPVDVPVRPIVDPASYELGDEIARGGMGRIVSARDKRLGRTVAIKILLSPKPLLAARFAREATITARLQHPAIVPIHETGRRLDGEPFYVMKLVEGRSLDVGSPTGRAA
jgi:serine/threonine protein kinase